MPTLAHCCHANTRSLLPCQHSLIAAMPTIAHCCHANNRSLLPCQHSLIAAMPTLAHCCHANTRSLLPCQHSLIAAMPTLAHCCHANTRSLLPCQHSLIAAMPTLAHCCHANTRSLLPCQHGARPLINKNTSVMVPITIFILSYQLKLTAARLKKVTAQWYRLANSARIFINLSWYDHTTCYSTNRLDIRYSHPSFNNSP